MTWSTPEGWTKVEPSSPQRSFQFERTLADGTQLELVVFAWPSGVGGVNMNLERWRSSVSRGEGDPEPRIETLEGKDMLITLFESRGTVTSMSGEKTPGQVMMRAYIESPAGRFEGVQTVNLTGPAAATEPLLPSIREWLRNQ
ncbi:MAG: hypothetical protein R3F17_17365 [Planctomycetota bacterium]